MPGFSAVAVMVRSAGVMFSARLALPVSAVGVVESVTLMVTLPLLGPAGVPVMAPVEGLIESPPGRPVADQVYGGVPPVAASVALYGWPAVPVGSSVVVMGGGAMFRARLTVAVSAVGVVESVTLIVTFPLLPAVGVPVMAPDEALIERPAGKPVADHEYGVVPPVAARVAL